MSDNIYAPQKKYAKKQRELGYVPVTVWVPEYDRDTIVEIADKMRKQHNG